MIENLNKNILIEKLVTNLPALRARMKISQAELAEIVGIGRQTLISIENHNSKMRWDTFLAVLLVVSCNNDALELLSLLGLNLQDVKSSIENYLISRKPPSLQEKIWTDTGHTGESAIRGIVPAPRGYANRKCPKCQSGNIRGAIITPTSDEQDPNLICLDCGFWWD